MAHGPLKLRARVSATTKELFQRLRPGECAVVDHQDLDEVCAQSLLELRVRAVLNAADLASGRYPNPGPALLLKEGVHLVDRLGPAILESIREGDIVRIEGAKVFRDGQLVSEGRLVTQEVLEDAMERGYENLRNELNHFVDNTLRHAVRESQAIVGGGLQFPQLRTNFAGRHALVVVRGHSYKEDLRAISSYIDEVRPVLIGVDGGADALIELGLKPDVIVGDMDSVSDSALQSGAEIVVHAYCDGRAPGLKRLRDIGTPAVTVPAPGTSEDVAMLLAYEGGAEMIVAVGSHSNAVDFLEKGRSGMASTILVRMKIGSRLIDARGVSELYKGNPKGRYALQIALAAAIPLALIVLLSRPLRQLAQLMVIWLKMITGL